MSSEFDVTKKEQNLNESDLFAQAANLIRQVKSSNGGLLICTGAGMSVLSGVPVFRQKDGSMSAEFLKYLEMYNEAVRKAKLNKKSLSKEFQLPLENSTSESLENSESDGLKEAHDWFAFSRPEMFQPQTERPAWAYWRWRIARSRDVVPGRDYELLNKLMQWFGDEGNEGGNVGDGEEFGCHGYDSDVSEGDSDSEELINFNRHIFVQTSNVDGMHEKASPLQIHSEKNFFEIHGSLNYLQCSKPCSRAVVEVDDKFLGKMNLSDLDGDWEIPRCPLCYTKLLKSEIIQTQTTSITCLRPNVMIFRDYALNTQRINLQEKSFKNWIKRHNTVDEGANWVVLEIGAGSVVPSMRMSAEEQGRRGRGLIRVNPSLGECARMELGVKSHEELKVGKNYFPLVCGGYEALKGICEALGL